MITEQEAESIALEYIPNDENPYKIITNLEIINGIWSIEVYHKNEDLDIFITSVKINRNGIVSELMKKYIGNKNDL